jgi:thioredoxin family protein
MALASPQVRAICVEANEFPYLSNQFRVRGVPHTVINRKAAFVGALPEPDFVAAVLEGAGVEITPHPDPPPQGGREIPRGPSTDMNAAEAGLG